MAQAVSTTPAKDVPVWFRLKTRLVVYLNLLKCLNRTRWAIKNNCSLINHIIIFRLSSQRKCFDAADGTFPEWLDLYQGAAPNQTKKKPEDDQTNFRVLHLKWTNQTLNRQIRQTAAAEGFTLVSTTALCVVTAPQWNDKHSEPFWVQRQRVLR